MQYGVCTLPLAIPLPLPLIPDRVLAKLSSGQLRPLPVREDSRFCSAVRRDGSRCSPNKALLSKLKLRRSPSPGLEASPPTPLPHPPHTRFYPLPLASKARGATLARPVSPPTSCAPCARPHGTQVPSSSVARCLLSPLLTPRPVHCFTLPYRQRPRNPVTLCVRRLVPCMHTSCNLAYYAYFAFPCTTYLCFQSGLGPSRNAARCDRWSLCAHPLPCVKGGLTLYHPARCMPVNRHANTASPTVGGAIGVALTSVCQTYLVCITGVLYPRVEQKLCILEGKKNDEIL